SRGFPPGCARRDRGARRRVVRRRRPLAVHAVRVRRRGRQGRSHPGGASCRRHGARADREPCAASALLRPALRVRATDRGPRAREHVVQHARRTDRLHAARCRRMLLHVAARCAGDRLVRAREGGNVMRRVSVVVPSFKRPAELHRCLTALAAQTLPAEAFEIIVVHDGPSETARRLVAQWTKKLAARGGPLVRYRSPPHRGPAAARNTGWRVAEAEIVAFTDDDTVPAPDWLAAALAAMQPGVDAAWGRIVVPLPTDPTDYEIDAARLSVSQFVTANCFLKKCVLKRVGGFDERFERAWREDSDLYFRLI